MSRTNNTTDDRDSTTELRRDEMATHRWQRGRRRRGTGERDRTVRRDAKEEGEQEDVRHEEQFT